MKKDYLAPRCAVIPIIGVEQSFCASTGALNSLEEKDDLGGISWTYNE